ncbi:MAG TPA: hypothetical protein VFU00_11865 [Gemmatimonadales bacterium]|nr:hypothetical protein [Gemmatimonadales bacterium]
MPSARGTAREIREVLDQLARPADAMILSVGGHTLSLTNLGKELWPGTRGRGLTKRDLLRYYTAISSHLLDHVRGRPVFVTRYPHGISGQSFYQKVWERRPPFVKTVRIWSSDRAAARDYLSVENLPTLLWLGQQAALELHVWFSRTTGGPDGKRLGANYAESEATLAHSRLNYPDFLVFDLDSYVYSGKEVKGAEPELHRRGFDSVRGVAHEVRRIAESVGLTVFVKTSGRTGLHLYAPIVRRFTFDEARAMAETIGWFLSARRPRDVTLEWAVEKRTGKVFFDYNQNVRGKSLAAAYSARRHAAATVSMPITWEELDTVYPTDFTILTAPEIVERRGDPWAHILEAKTDLDALLEASASMRAG